jgi:archaellum biogenesis ATPase FlaH
VAQSVEETAKKILELLSETLNAQEDVIEFVDTLFARTHCREEFNDVTDYMHDVVHHRA